MNIYDCKVKPGGSRFSEIRKVGITAAEIILLRDIHGEDNVVEIQKVGEYKRGIDPEAPTDADIREHLERLYRVEKSEKAATRYAAVFGRRHMPLPTTIPSIPGTEIDEDGATNTPRPRRFIRKGDLASAAAV